MSSSAMPLGFGFPLRVDFPSPRAARRSVLPLTGAARLGMLRAVVRDDDLDEERRLVERAQAGDRRAVGELLTRHGPGLYRSVLLPRLGSEAAAREALAETYAKVVERIGRFTWQNVGFYPWLRTVAMRVAIDQLRARKRLLLWEAEDVEREVDASSTATPVDQKLSDRRDGEAARARVAEALARIHPRYANAIRLRVLEEKPREEVAAELGVSAATFDVLLHRATAALKKALAAEPSSAPPPRPRRSPQTDDSGKSSESQTDD